METLVQSLVENLGVFGIALLMFLENIFPPIPSELIMPLAGYLAARGEISLLTVIFAGTAGSLLGILPWYFLGRAFGQNRLELLAARYGRWLTMTPDDVTAAVRVFNRYGPASVLCGRLVPAVRTLISVPAGLARMPFSTFFAYSAVGTFLWTTFLTLSGYTLGQAYESVSAYVDPVSTTVLVLIVLIYIYRVVTFRPQRT